MDRIGQSNGHRTARSGVGARDRVVVLVYHSVDRGPRPANTTPGRLRGHLEWLTTHCQIISLRDVLTATTSPGGARPRVALTFDDGFANNHELGLPLLLEYGMTATFFVTTGLVNGDALVLARFARMLGLAADRIRGLSWTQVAELDAAGMSIGAHTVTHPNLRELDAESARREIAWSKQELEQRLGIEVESFAYPFGKPKHHYTAETLRLVEESGFSLAAAVHFTRVRATDRRFEIPRFSVAEDDTESLRRIVSGTRDGLGIWQRAAPRWLTHLVSPGNSYRGEGSLL